MKEIKDNLASIKDILEDQETTEEEEEILHSLLQERVSKDYHIEHSNKLTLGQKAADKLANFAGSWTFIIIFFLILLFWIGLNSYMLAKPFDIYPFILLNLILSCLAAIQAPIIMMSQNRQEEKDRIRSKNDYKINLKSEILIEDIHKKLDDINKKLEALDKFSERSSKSDKNEKENQS